VGTSKRRHTYGSYLELDKLLSCQNTKTTADSELLFIVIHQSNELWFKVLIHEFENAIASLYRGDELSAYKVLSRASQILLLLTRTWDVLSTLTPNEFRVFRDSVGQDNASGFQSHQYRMVEFLLGLKSPFRSFDTQEGEKNVDVIAIHGQSLIREQMLRQRRKPSIYDATLHLLSRRFRKSGLQPKPQQGDFSEGHQYSQPAYQCWHAVYSTPQKYMSLFQLAEKLIDVEDAFRQWRFRHLVTVARVIGQNTGTGGSTGLRYLQKVAIGGMEHPLFPEIWEVRNQIYEPSHPVSASSSAQETPLSGRNRGGSRRRGPRAPVPTRSDTGSSGPQHTPRKTP
jgi:tryptophan 2,3-dioxygenase